MPRAKRVQTIDTYKNFKTGAKTSVGTSAVQISTTSFKTKKGVLVKALSSNGTAIIYVGGSTVTALTDATSGIELAASEWVVVEVNDVSDVYVIGSTTGLGVTWIIV